MPPFLDVLGPHSSRKAGGAPGFSSRHGYRVPCPLHAIPMGRAWDVSRWRAHITEYGGIHIHTPTSFSTPRRELGPAMSPPASQRGGTRTHIPSAAAAATEPGVPSLSRRPSARTALPLGAPPEIRRTVLESNQPLGCLPAPSSELTARRNGVERELNPQTSGCSPALLPIRAYPHHRRCRDLHPAAFQVPLDVLASERTAGLTPSPTTERGRPDWD